MKTQTEHGYGFFHGGDPRKFWPDHECCTPKEIENHKAACKLWDEAEARGEMPTPEANPSGWLHDDKGNIIGHVLRSPYGIGTYEFEVEDGDDEPSNTQGAAAGPTTEISTQQSNHE